MLTDLANPRMSMSRPEWSSKKLFHSQKKNACRLPVNSWHQKEPVYKYNQLEPPKLKKKQINSWLCHRWKPDLRHQTSVLRPRPQTWDVRPQPSTCITWSPPSVWFDRLTLISGMEEMRNCIYRNVVVRDVFPNLQIPWPPDLWARNKRLLLKAVMMFA